MKRTCPICGKTFTTSDPPRPPAPFCSQRCKMVDLGNWLDERYRIPVDAGWEAPGDLPDEDIDLASSGRKLH